MDLSLGSAERDLPGLCRPRRRRCPTRRRPLRCRAARNGASLPLLLLAAAALLAGARAEEAAAPVCQPGLLKLDEPRAPPERALLPFCEEVRACPARRRPACGLQELAPSSWPGRHPRCSAAVLAPQAAPLVLCLRSVSPGSRALWHETRPQAPRTQPRPSLGHLRGSKRDPARRSRPPSSAAAAATPATRSRSRAASRAPRPAPSCRSRAARRCG